MWPFKAKIPKPSWMPKFKVGDHVYVPADKIGYPILYGYGSGIIWIGVIGAIKTDGWYIVNVEGKNYPAIFISEEFLTSREIT